MTLENHCQLRGHNTGIVNSWCRWNFFKRAAPCSFKYLENWKKSISIPVIIIKCLPLTYITGKDLSSRSSCQHTVYTGICRYFQYILWSMISNPWGLKLWINLDVNKPVLHSMKSFWIYAQIYQSSRYAEDWSLSWKWTL